MPQELVEDPFVQRVLALPVVIGEPPARDAFASTGTTQIGRAVARFPGGAVPVRGYRATAT
ncbi:hypothetical protein DT019_34370 [Streptomyces sp. SDr-06]|nr:hypothetical protein DT019_34370 [Streptomyces sp. SDr-06]